MWMSLARERTASARMELSRRTVGASVALAAGARQQPDDLRLQREAGQVDEVERQGPGEGGGDLALGTEAEIHHDRTEAELAALARGRALGLQRLFELVRGYRALLDQHLA